MSTTKEDEVDSTFITWYKNAMHLKGSSIRTSAPKGEGVCQMRTLLLIFSCKMPKYVDAGGRGTKNGQILIELCI